MLGVTGKTLAQRRRGIREDRAANQRRSAGSYRTRPCNWRRSTACLRLGYAAVHVKGAHLLPAIMTAPLEATLVRSVAESELRRALKAAVTVLTDELEQTDSRLAARLSPMLAELGGKGQE